MLALFTQAVPRRLPESFIAAARMEFGDYPPGLYAESGFPLAGAFLLKLDGLYEEIAPTKTSDVFQQLLALDASVRLDVPMLWAYSIAHLPTQKQKTCSIGEFFSLIDLTRELTETETAKLLSFKAAWSFLHFCKNLYKILSDIENQTVAGLVRNYYAYILDITSDDRSSALWSCATTALQVEGDEVDDSRELFPETVSLIEEVDSLKTPFLEVTNRELWPLPSDLQFLLTDRQFEFTL